MTATFQQLTARLGDRPERWLVTGAAGFIGSHLLSTLLLCDQEVVGLDDYSTGHPRNLDAVRREVGETRWARLHMIEGDIRDPQACRVALDGVDRVLHQAALGSVPRSLESPEQTHQVNVDGFVQVALAAVRARVRGFVFASSSSVYGDHQAVPKVESVVGRPLSPYAASKRMNEVYAEALATSYGLPAVGLRYFNVVGPRQPPDGPYAAVVPKWLDCLRRGARPVIFGDGETSRDFCPVPNVVQANLLAAFAPVEHHGVTLNVALGGQTTLRELFVGLRDGMARRGAPCSDVEAVHTPPRPGDVRHSRADIGRARAVLGYAPACTLHQGLDQAMDAFMKVRA